MLTNQAVKVVESLPSLGLDQVEHKRKQRKKVLCVFPLTWHWVTLVFLKHFHSTVLIETF